MAARKRAPLSVVIDTDGDTETEATAQAGADDVAESATPAPAKKATRSPRKKSTAAPAKKTTARKPAAKKTAAPAKAEAEPEAEPLRVKGVDTADAKRASLYLHPDDYRALQLAKLDDGADLNSRMRAMIALWQHNARFRAAVDRLAKDAPRGGSKF